MPRRVDDGRWSAAAGPAAAGAAATAKSDDPTAAGARADVAAAFIPIALFAVAAVTAAALALAGQPVGAGAAPLFAQWHPHAGPGTAIAVATAALVAWQGPRMAARLTWPRLLGLGYAAAVVWTSSLALIDGWQRGLAGRLTTRHEYLSEADAIVDIPTMVRGFSGRILDLQPDSWTTHVAGHPPGALLLFVALDRTGLGGGGWAAIACVLAGASTAVAVPTTVRTLADEAAARAAVPFAVLFPGAVWIGASADGLFAGVTACGTALLASALTHHRPAPAVAGGALLGLGVYLSYGLVLMLPILIAVALASRRQVLASWRRFTATAGATFAGAAAIAAAFTMAGFWWLDGYHLTVQRYYQGIASQRPYAYWAWANLALLCVCAGPAAAAVLRRATAGLTGRRTAANARISAAAHRRTATSIRPPAAAVLLLPLAAAIAMLTADLSGLSKAEVERIWLPFAVWLVAGASLIPPSTRRRWLAVQGATALVVNHLLLTPW